MIFSDYFFRKFFSIFLFKQNVILLRKHHLKTFKNFGGRWSHFLSTWYPIVFPEIISYINDPPKDLLGWPKSSRIFYLSDEKVFETFFAPKTERQVHFALDTQRNSNLLSEFFFGDFSKTFQRLCGNFWANPIYKIIVKFDSEFDEFVRI